MERIQNLMTMMNNKYGPRGIQGIRETTKVCFALMFFVFVAAVHAQDELPSSQVVIQKDFEVELLDFDKINFAPDLEQSNTRRSFPYELGERIFSVDYPKPDIQPIGYKSDFDHEKYDHYLRAGYGLPNSIYGKLSSKLDVTDNLQIGANGFYRDIDDDSYDFRRGSVLESSLEGTYQSDLGFVATGNVFYNADSRDLYGFDHTDTTLNLEDSSALENTFDHFGLTLGIADQKGDENPFIYQASVGYDRFTTNNDIEEDRYRLQGGVEKWLGYVPLKLNIGANFLTTSRDTMEYDLDVVRIIPASGYHGKNFRIDAGLNMAYFNDEFTIFPQIEAAVNLLGSGLQLYAGVDGDVQPLSHSFVSRDNPFIVPQLGNYTFMDWTDVYGGVQGLVSSMKYYVQLGYKEVNNVNLYSAVTLDDYFSTTAYDLLVDTMDVFYAKGSIEFPVMEGVTVLSSLTFNSYDPVRSEEAWYLPSLIFDAGVQLSLLDNSLNILGQVSIADRVETPISSEIEERNVNSLLDVNLSADWFMTPSLGLFLDINNLMNREYARFYDYQTTGLNVNFGVVARL